MNPRRETLQTNSADSERAWQDFILPYRNFLLRMNIFPEIIKDFELRNDRPQLDFDQLNEAYQKEGQLGVQKLKHAYIKETIAHRTQHGIGVALKSRAQLLLQDPSGSEKNSLGDPSTFTVDPLDRESCVAAAKFLIETQKRSHLWMGFAMTSDWTDPYAVHPSTRPPILGRDRPINTVSDFEAELIKAQEIIFNERVTKIARKLSRAANRHFTKLDMGRQKELMERQKLLARTMLGEAMINGGWEKLNEQLIALNLKPLHQEDHGLMKIFSQDNSSWQIADLIVDEKSLVLDFPRARLTHRADEESGKLPISFTIKKLPHSKPIILGNPDDVSLLSPVLNSKKFFEQFDTDVLPNLGNSPYHQLEFMMELGMAVKDINPDNRDQALKNGKVSFISDIISGINVRNKKDKNGAHNVISPMIANIDPENINGTAVVIPENLKHIATNFPDYLYKLLSNTTGNSQITEYDQVLAGQLLSIFDGWAGYLHLEPSTKKVLEEISQTGKRYTPIRRILTNLELQMNTAGMIV